MPVIGEDVAAIVRRGWKRGGSERVARDGEAIGYFRLACEPGRGFQSGESVE